MQTYKNKYTTNERLYHKTQLILCNWEKYTWVSFMHLSAVSDFFVMEHLSLYIKDNKLPVIPELTLLHDLLGQLEQSASGA